MSHRTPLTGIKAAATSLLSDLHLDESQRKDMLMVINEEADRLNHLVGEAAEMAQLDAHVELRMERVAVRSSVTDAMEQSRVVLGQHPVGVRVADPEPQIKIDKMRVVKVLQQLLENAAKYSLSETPIAAETQGSQLVMSVLHQHALITRVRTRGIIKQRRVENVGA
jgi:two-component system, OmpR family, sensor histidine kinase KdpD